MIGDGKLEIGEVWNDNLDVAAARSGVGAWAYAGDGQPIHFGLNRAVPAVRFTEPCEPESAPVAPGRKDDAGKLRWDLLPSSVRAVVEVITYGAGKYGDNNWRSLASPRARYGAAAFRHMTAWLWGERCDVESGLPHLAHAATNMLFLLELDK